MNINDAVNKGKEFLEQNKDRIEEVLHSEQVEGVSDTVLEAGAEFVKKLTPDNLDGHVDAVRNNLDKSIGNE